MQDEWINRAFYDLIHPEDLLKVRDQLCGIEGNRMLDLKTGTVKRDYQGSGRIHLNCRRGFICRIRIGNLQLVQIKFRNRLKFVNAFIINFKNFQATSAPCHDCKIVFRFLNLPATVMQLYIVPDM